MPQAQIEKLSSQDIHERADAGRQLARVGLPEHIAPLLHAAIEDPSPGVRLYAVGAAADILSRYRVGMAKRKISQAKRQALFEIFRGVDPGQNAGVFSVMAVLELPRLPRRLLVGLQDPRLDVRTGAIVGVYRYFISHSASKNKALKKDVLKLLGGRLRPDVMSAIVRLIGNCGWQDASGLAQGLRGRFGQVDEAIEQTLSWLQEQADPSSLQGVWASYDADAGQVTAHTEPLQQLLLVPGSAMLVESGQARIFAWSFEDGKLALEQSKPLRRMMLDEPIAHQMVQALQLGNQTWYRSSKTVVELAEDFADAQDLDTTLAAPLAAHFLEALPDTPTGHRTTARLELVSGQVDLAVEHLQELSQRTRVAAEVWFFLGEAMLASGDLGAARRAWSTFLEGARKNDALRERAQARLDA